MLTLLARLTQTQNPASKSLIAERNGIERHTYTKPLLKPTKIIVIIIIINHRIFPPHKQPRSLPTHHLPPTNKMRNPTHDSTSSYDTNRCPGHEREEEPPGR